MPFLASEHEGDGKKHLLLAASGSVATIKLPLLAQTLSRHDDLSIIIVLTASATRFLAGQSAEQPALETLRRLPNVQAIFRDEDEWEPPWRRGAGILHIELRRWADLMLIAPLSANTLAKIVAGFSDNLVLSVVRAWDTTGALDSTRELESGSRGRSEGTGKLEGTGESEGKGDLEGMGELEGKEELEGKGELKLKGRAGKRPRKRIVVAPAMNTAMWTHPITSRQIAVLKDEWGIKDGIENGHGNGDIDGGGNKDEDINNDANGWFQVLMPEQKTLACGDVGDGAMMDWKEIVKVVETILELTADATNKKT